MNQYGRRAQRHWLEFRPGHIAEIDDSEAFFSKLGTDVQGEVRARWSAERLSAPAVVGESCLERAGRLKQLRHEAEAEVLRELVLLPAEDDVDLADDPHLTESELTEEQWRGQDLYDLLAGRSRPGDFSAAERERLRAGALARLLEYPGLSDEPLGRQGVLLRSGNRTGLGHPRAALGADPNEVYARWIRERPVGSASLGESSLEQTNRYGRGAEAEVLPEPALLSRNGVSPGRGPQIGGHGGAKGFMSSLCLGASLTSVAAPMASTPGGVDHVG
ncbi:hypothetical protein AB0G86_05820 [Streptomyces scabiei]|uniref:hypothetical protein n=1 Tax=Streptomyces scabiei TaxID=1930 RepID=UPI0033E0E7B4